MSGPAILIAALMAFFPSVLAGVLANELDRRGLSIALALLAIVRRCLPAELRCRVDEWEDDVRSGCADGVAPLVAAVRFALLVAPRLLARHWVRSALGRGARGSASMLAELFDHVHELLAGRLRYLVPHGFAVLSAGENSFTLTVPAIWKPVRGARIATASEVVSTDNLEELRQVLEAVLLEGDGCSRGELVSWEQKLPDGPRPGRINWTVTGTIRWV